MNSYPVTAMKVGVQTFAPAIFGGAPDIVVSGPNVGGKQPSISALRMKC